MIQFIIVQNLNSIQAINVRFFQIIITIIKNLIWFLIELFLGTYTCLLQALITNTAEFAVNTSESIIVGVNTTIVTLANDIEDGLSGLSKIINDLISVGSKIANFFTGDINNNDNGQQYQNSINLSISGLRNLSIPSSVLTNINNFKLTTLPNFTNIETDTKDLISIPLNKFLNQTSLITRPINGTSMDSTFPQFPISSLCSNSTNKYNQDLTYLVSKVEMASKAIFIFLSLCCVLSIIPLIFQHFYYYYIKLPQLISDLNRRSEENCNDNAAGEIIQMNNTLHSFYNSSWILNLFYKLFNLNTNQHYKLKWLIAYLTTKYCVIILGIGLAGLLTCFLQFIIILILNKEVSLTITYLEQSINPNNATNTSTSTSISQYISEVNQFIQSEESQINEELFGNILDTTSSINTTIATFVDNLNNTIFTTFQDIRILDATVSTIVYCTLIRKLVKVEQGLTWINDNLKISIPLMNSTTFEQQLVDLLDNSQATSTSNNELRSMIKKTIDLYKQTLKVEFLVSVIFLGVWGLQLLTGLTILAIQSRVNRPTTISLAPSTSTLPPPPPPHYDFDNIGSPQPLTIAQKHEYGYPFTNPYDEKVYSTSSRYPSTLELI